jgi:hypothetical protein
VAGLLVVLAAGATVTGAAPAAAHDADELAAWLTAWVAQVVAADGPTTALVAEYLNMADRHPCAMKGICPKPTRQPRTATYRGMGNDVERWRPLVAAYFPPHLVNKALCVMDGESGGNPNADNEESSALGLWQFLDSTWAKARRLTGAPAYPAGALDPTWATRTAAAWLAATSWSQWNAARHC